MDKNKYKYHIGDTDYVQRPLVIGQVKQLMDVLGAIILTAYIDVSGIISILGDKLPSALAVILTPDGMHPRDKDIAALSDNIAYTMDINTAIRVVEDFFGLNPIASVLGRLNGMIETMQKNITGQMNSSVSSPEEILQNGMQSSGGIPSENASHISRPEGGI